MPCSISVDNVQCPAPCETMLPCGHQCAGTCGRCNKRRSHELCLKPCSRLLACSHHCQATCTEPCPPCVRECSRRCPHERCVKPCSQPCKPCREPVLGFVRITSAKIYVENYATAFSVKLPVPRSLSVATRALAYAGKIVPQSVVFAMLKRSLP